VANVAPGGYQTLKRIRGADTRSGHCLWACRTSCRTVGMGWPWGSAAKATVMHGPGPPKSLCLLYAASTQCHHWRGPYLAWASGAGELYGHCKVRHPIFHSPILTARRYNWTALVRSRLTLWAVAMEPGVGQPRQRRCSSCARLPHSSWLWHFAKSCAIVPWTRSIEGDRSKSGKAARVPLVWCPFGRLTTRC
jgi:hypothetical protein